MWNKLGIMLALLLILGGCYDYRETDNMAIVSGIHVSKGGEKLYRVTFEIVATEEGEERGKTAAMEGITIAQAIDDATSLSGKKLYFGHTQILAFDYEMGKDGINETLDYFTRMGDMRLSMNVLVSKNISGEELFAGENDIRSFVLDEMIRANEERAITPSVRLYELVSDSLEMGKDGYIPAVQKDENGNMVMVSTALFKDMKLVGELDEEGTKYLMVLGNIGNKGGFVLERETGTPLSFEIRSRKTKITPHIVSGRLVCDVTLEAEVSMLEMTGNTSVLQEKSKENIEQELEKYVFEKMHEVLRKLRDNHNADCLGIGKKLLEKDEITKEYLEENFDELYSNSHFNVRVDVEITDSGRTLRRLAKLR
ncbi:MAG: Ger(x)C family spore germination protein [Clostridia bacterium]|nr:Ger(x)C family spore germination protein [Clostridia bacterium]